MEPIQGHHNEYGTVPEDTPRCARCEILLDETYAQAHADYQMADICGACVVRDIDRNEEAIHKCTLRYLEITS